MADQTQYEHSDKLILLVEDDPEQRENLKQTALRYFGGEAGVCLCVAKSATEAITALPGYWDDSPKARLYAVLDHNMGLNVTGERKPTEALFYDPTFQHYMENGGVVIIYSGYPEQVRQSAAILQAPQRYAGLVLLLAEKSAVQLDDVFRLLQRMTDDAIPRLKSVAAAHQFDLGKLLDVLRGV